MEVRKCTKSLGTLIIRPIERNLAKSMIVANHYSHKWNDSFGIMNFGIFKENSDKCLGVAVFGRMMNSHSFKSISEDLNMNEIIELNRLWVDDCLGHNAESLFIGACLFCVRNILKSRQFRVLQTVVLVAEQFTKRQISDILVFIKHRFTKTKSRAKSRTMR